MEKHINELAALTEMKDPQSEGEAPKQQDWSVCAGGVSVSHIGCKPLMIIPLPLKLYSWDGIHHVAMAT